MIAKKNGKGIEELIPLFQSFQCDDDFKQGAIHFNVHCATM